MIRRLLFSLLVAVPLIGCVTPMIPLPPPSPSTFELTIDASSGTVVLRSKSNLERKYQNALIYLFNTTKGTGVITQVNAKGDYLSEPMSAVDGDRLDLWVARFAEDESSSVHCLVVNSKSSAQYDGFDLCN